MFSLPKKHTGYLALLFVLFLTLFNWPLLTIADQYESRSIFFYLFGNWALLILMMWLVDRFLEKEGKS